jgi:deoxyadenosine/deoxycytidine kinase
MEIADHVMVVPGKTTILSKMREKHPEWTFIDEPVDLWTNLRTDQGESLLEVFYKDRKRWSYTFQNCALLTRYQMIESSIQKVREHGPHTYPYHIFLTERCLDTDHQVFTKMLRADGSIDALELNLYEKLLTHLKKSAIPVSAIVHVDTAPTICYNRIKIRARDGEDNIPLTYLEALDKYQCQWVDNAGIPLIKTEERGFEKVEEFIRDLQFHAETVIQPLKMPMNKSSVI